MRRIGGHACGHLAGNGANLALERTHAGLACVFVDHLAQRAVGDLNLFCRQAVLLALSRNQILARDVDLFVLGVAAQRDHLHAVEQCRMDGAELICRGDEEHPRQVDGNLEVVVAEGVILRGVQYFEERCRRISLDTDRDLVDFVQHQDRVR
jgi:hypothetical protein